GRADMPGPLVEDPTRTGAATLFDGLKRMGSNFFDSTDGPNGSLLVSDFDSDMSQWAGHGAPPEVMPAPGDSGGPSFLWGPGGQFQIAAIDSYGTVGSGFGSHVWETRVSSFADWIDQTVNGPYQLVVDMNHQLAGNDGSADSIVLS